MMDSTAKKVRVAASARTIAAARTCTVVAAAVMGAVGIGVINAAPADAIPPAPLAPACTSWKIANFELVLNLANGQTAIMNIAQNEPQRNTLLIPGGKKYVGNSSGGLSGSKIDITVRWVPQFDNNDGERPIITSTFIGEVGGDGFARGSALDNKNARVDWVSRDRFTCADQPPEPTPPPQEAPPPQQQAPPPEPMATVISDVDLYDAPGGDGNVIGILRAGTKVPFGCRDDNWCRAGGEGGWVWGDFLQKP